MRASIRSFVEQRRDALDLARADSALASGHAYDVSDRLCLGIRLGVSADLLFELRLQVAEAEAAVLSAARIRTRAFEAYLRACRLQNERNAAHVVRLRPIHQAMQRAA